MDIYNTWDWTRIWTHMLLLIGQEVGYIYSETYSTRVPKGIIGSLRINIID